VGIMKPIMKGSRSLFCLVLGLAALLMAERAEADLLAVAPACVSGPLDSFLARVSLSTLVGHTGSDADASTTGT
jgi:hypothetical protein